MFLPIGQAELLAASCESAKGLQLQHCSLLWTKKIQALHSNIQPLVLHVHSETGTCALALNTTRLHRLLESANNDFKGSQQGCYFCSSCLRPNMCTFCKLACRKHRHQSAAARSCKGQRKRQHCCWVGGTCRAQRIWSKQGGDTPMFSVCEFGELLEAYCRVTRYEVTSELLLCTACN